MPKQPPQQWTIDRRQELSDLLELLSTVESLNRSTNFIDNTQKCIAIAASLTRYDPEKQRPSFFTFLLQQAASNNDLTDGNPSE